MCQELLILASFRSTKHATRRLEPIKFCISCQIRWYDACFCVTYTLSQACDVYIYTNTPDPDKLRTCKYALYSEPSLHFSTVNRLIALLQSSVSYPLEQSRWSHFASVTLPFISRRTVAAISRASQHVDALELRIDCLKNSSTNALHQQLAYLRNQTSLPIIATLRSCREFGDFTGSNKEKFRIYRELLRSGVDYIDIEARSCSNMLPAFIQNAKNNYCSKIIGSVHTSKICDSAAILQMFSEASLNKTADIAKVVTGAATAADCLSMLTASRYVQEPHIGLCIGNAGVITRVHNEVLTPVRAEGMIAAAPGQLSVKKLMQLRIQHGLLRPKRYYLLGSAIQQSRSPAMHNAAFNETLLPHNYSLHDVDAIDQVRSMLHSDFGGASVTIPFKQSVVSLLRNITSDAREIGAVNTIIIDAEHNLVGHNTDWIGIYTPLQKLLGANRHVGSHALVIGAGILTRTRTALYTYLHNIGGTAMAACYALQQLKLKLVIAARNETEGRVLANRLLLDLRLEDNMFRFGANYVNTNETENLNKNNIAVCQHSFTYVVICDDRLSCQQFPQQRMFLFHRIYSPLSLSYSMLCTILRGQCCCNKYTLESPYSLTFLGSS